MITILTVCILTIIPTANAAEINILDNHSSYVTPLGTYHVVGEIVNAGTESVAFVSITGTFYDSNNTEITADTSLATLEVLPPGIKSPFEIIVTDLNQAEKIHNYTLAVTDYNPVAKTLTKTLLILSNSSHISLSGLLNIDGQIKNNGTSESTTNRVAVTCYDGNGTVVAIESAFTDPQNLDPEETAQFNLLIGDANQSAKVENYALQVQSTEAILIPEFQLSQIFIFLTLILTLAVIRKIKEPRFKYNILN